MSKLLIFIGEDQKFDVEAAINAITSMSGVSKPRRGNFIGAIFECEYSQFGRHTVVRLSPEAETITVEGVGEEFLGFALELQSSWPQPLSAIDLDYRFSVALGDFRTVDELKRAVQS